MKIIIETIRHKDHRLPNSFGGDWFWSNKKSLNGNPIPTQPDGEGDLIIRVSDTGNWRMNFLFARHELDEAMLCFHAGITTEMVDADELKATPSDDPDSLTGYPGSCYQQQHNDALCAEWVMSRLLGVSWEEYGNKVSSLK